MGTHAKQRPPRSLRVVGSFALALVMLGGAAVAARALSDNGDGELAQSSIAAGADATSSPEIEISRATLEPRAVRLAPDALPSPKKSGVDKKKADKLRTKTEQQSQVAATAVFKVASLNVLGASHSDGGNAGRYANGAGRTSAAAAKIRALGISVVGLQEYEPENHSAFVRSTGWGVWPGMQLGVKGVRNSIAWNPSVWQLVEAHTSTFPYFRGQPVPLPYVLLEHQATGRKAWFISIHNPVSNGQRGNNQHWRDVATAKEAALVRSLKAQYGYPVFLTGDFNERDEALRGITGGGGIVAAGVSGIDWIFGTSDVAFSGYVRDNSTIGKISDHPLVYATATLSGE